MMCLLATEAAVAACHKHILTSNAATVRQERHSLQQSHTALITLISLYIVGLSCSRDIALGLVTLGYPPLRSDYHRIYLKLYTITTGI